jgi:Type I restriction-modification system methyltransferase subunit
LLAGAVGQDIRLYNLSRLTFASLKGQDPKDIHKNLLEYITKFSPNVRDIFLDKFLFTDQLKRLNDAGLLFRVFDQFTQIDLHPEVISNLEMGYLFEELIRRFSEISNETAGEHYTPREVIRLIVSLLLVNDREALTGSGVIRQVYDPAAGTGGMLSLAEMEMKALNPRIRVELYGQELNPESYAICKSDMLVKLYVYTSWLSRLLPSRDVPADITITDDMLDLSAFKLQKDEEGSASLSPGQTATLQPITEFGANAYTEEEERSLSEIINSFNERHGTQFSREDFLRFERVTRDC